jgi:hypothetical protein
MAKKVPKVAGGSLDTQVNKEESWVWAIYRQTPPHRAGFSFFLAQDCEYRGRKELSAGSKCDMPNVIGNPSSLRSFPDQAGVHPPAHIVPQARHMVK